MQENSSVYNHDSLSSNWMSSHKWYLEILGALIMSKTKAIFHLAIILLLIGGFFCFSQWRTAFYIAAATLAVMLVWQIVSALNPIYCLRKEESRITWSQIVLLAAMGGWLLVVIKVLHQQRIAIVYYRIGDRCGFGMDISGHNKERGCIFLSAS